MPLANTTAATRPSRTEAPIRVMVVDDSAVIRGLTIRVLEADPAIEVAASLSNGKLAVDKLSRDPVDVVVLDIEMPVMDGLTALPLILKAQPKVRVVMSSTLTQRNAEISIQALRAGAADYIPKPSAVAGMSSADFKDELIKKVKSLGRARPPVSTTKGANGASASLASTKPAAPVAVAKKEPSKLRPKLLAIGSSTGGPQALFKFVEKLDRGINVPVIVTQHMPPTFTRILAEHITKSTDWPCHEGIPGEALEPGIIYLAPGDYHMVIEKKDGTPRIALNQDAPENFCRPAVDPMLRSAVDAFGGRVLTTILTGMGSDGMRGCQTVVESGGTVVAQDEETSVVWGMPGAVARAGLCSAILPLDEMSDYINKRFRMGLS